MNEPSDAFAPATEHRVPRLTPAVQWLLLGAVATWVLQLTLLAPADVQASLGFLPRAFITRWWTIATYAFVHVDAWHLLLNGYVLWLFGPRVEQRWGSAAFVRFYMMCAIGGWFAHLVFGQNSATLIGATAPVLGVALAYARLWPDERVYLFGAVPTTSRWLVAIVGSLLVVDGALSTEIALGWGYFAHLGGAVAAWAVLRAEPSSTLERLRRGVSAIPDEPDEPMPRAVPRSAPRSRPSEQTTIDEVVAQANATPATRPVSRPARSPEPPPSDTLDRLLDKISQQGMDSLTADERRWLDDASKRLKRTDGTE